MTTTHDSIQTAFEAFHFQNPRVLDRLIELTDEYLARGHQRVGIKMLFEVLRWLDDIKTSGEPFKLNNNFTSRYVRLIIATRPDLRPAFNTRELMAA